MINQDYLFHRSSVTCPCSGERLKLLVNQNLSIGVDSLVQRGSLGPEPFVFGSYAVIVKHDELQPVFQFPVFDSILVQLVP